MTKEASFRKLLEWNNTFTDYPLEKTVVELFEARAKKTPNYIAVKCGNQSITYGALNKKANNLAHHLKSLGIRLEDPVAVCLKRNINSLISMLGIFKAGGCYVPIDSNYPKKRIAYILEHSKAPFLIADNATHQQIKNISQTLNSTLPTIINLQKQPSTRAQYNPATVCGPNNLAYIIYTSGSTGAPKGAMIEHRGMLNHLFAKIDDLQLSYQDVIAQTASVCFDISIWQFLVPLLIGGCTHILIDQTTLNPSLLLDQIEKKKITILEIVPSMLQMVLSEITNKRTKKINPLSLKWLISTGEKLPPKLCRQWFTYYPNIPILNAYGPTECSDDVTHYKITKLSNLETPQIPIGSPISNVHLYVLDDQMQPVPIGEPGELYVGGIAVGRGYLSSPELTKKAFIPNPFNPHSKNNKLYKTGDIVRWLSDGNIDFIGRIDDQVKIRGFRVELGEIDSFITQLPEISQSVVIAKEDSNGTNYLVAYLIPREKSTFNLSTLQDHLKKSLPEYLIPSRFVLLNKIPLTANGKIDHKTLQKRIDYDIIQSRSTRISPHTALENQLVHIWAEVLKLPVKSISVEDDFFGIGGHSLLTVKLAYSINQCFSTNITMSDIFDNPTITQLIKKISQTHSASPSPLFQSTNKKQNIPLSSAQERIWQHQQMSPDLPIFNEPMNILMPHAINKNILEKSLSEIVKRHEILRTRFTKKGRQVCQNITPCKSFHLPFLDLHSLPENKKDLQAIHHATQQAEQLFDLSNEPPIRFLLIKLSPEKYRLFITTHHIIEDAVMMFNVFMEELEQIYTDFLTGIPSSLPPLTLQYKDFAVWENKQHNQKKNLGYWESRLSNLPVLQLPTTNPFSEQVTFRGDRINFTLSKKITQAIKILSRKKYTTNFTVLLTVFNILLYRYTDQTDIPIGSIVSGRDHPQTERMMGNFLNTIILRNDLSNNPSFLTLLQRVKKNTILDYSHGFLPFQETSSIITQQKNRAKYPPIQVALVMEPGLSPSHLGWALSQLEVHPGTSKFHITFEIDEQDGAYFGRVEYNTGLFDAGYINRMIQHFTSLLENLLETPSLPINQVNMLTNKEEKALLTDWNATTKNYPLNKTIHELFEQQVKKTPNNIAVQYQKTKLTYLELNNKANQLAHYLRKKGVKAETLVAIYLDRSLDMLIGILGILKAGGAYVPIAPNNPESRIKYMLEDSQTKILLSHKYLINQLSPAIRTKLEKNSTILLDEAWPAIALNPIKNPSIITKPDNLIYVIYTSGSTGRPKGVINKHNSIVNRLLWMQDAYPLTEKDRILQKTPFTFDVSVWEFLWPLITGAKLVIALPEEHKNPQYILQTIKTQKISVIHFVPSMLSLFLQQEGLSECCSLKHVMCSGESLSHTLQKQFFDAFKKTELHNLYGPTEAAIDVTVWDCKRNDSRQIVPIGHPIANIQTYVLNKQLKLVPVGMTGELYLGGIGLGRGYLNQPALTKDNFITSPFDNALLYKTGDLVRWLPDGNLEFIGRTDRQVKLYGFRIELGEIEKTMVKHPCVHECVVTVRTNCEGLSYLAAYVVMCDPSKRACLDIIALRIFLKKYLPCFMIPATITFLKKFHLTPNGKIDRDELPEPIQEIIINNQNYAAPKTTIEKKLATVFKKALNVKIISIHDNFFDLGGYSILAVSTIRKVNQLFKVSLSPTQLYITSSIAELCTIIDSENCCNNQQICLNQCQPILLCK